MAKYNAKIVGVDCIDPQTWRTRADAIRPYGFFAYCHYFASTAIKIGSRKIIEILIYPYQWTRFMRPACCRFYPSCSDYCLQAIDTYGLIKGTALTLKRLLKCHPWHPGGVDLVGGIATARNVDLIVGADCIRPPLRRHTYESRAHTMRPYGFFVHSHSYASTANNGEV